MNQEVNDNYFKFKKMKVINKLYKKGMKLENQGHNSEAVKWYCFYNKCS